MFCRFPDGYSAVEMLLMHCLARRLGSPAIAAHCRLQILMKGTGAIASPADFDVQSWILAARSLQDSGYVYPSRTEDNQLSRIYAAVGPDLVPLSCLTDEDLRVLLDAEEALFRQRNHAKQHIHQKRINVSAAFHQASGASDVQETLQDPSSGSENSQMPPTNCVAASVSASSSRDVSNCVVCMDAPVQAGFLHGSR